MSQKLFPSTGVSVSAKVLDFELKMVCLCFIVKRFTDCNNCLWHQFKVNRSYKTVQ